MPVPEIPDLVVYLEALEARIVGQSLAQAVSIGEQIAVVQTRQVQQQNLRKGIPRVSESI